MFKKILIANRGEIAVRVMRACREMDISPVAVYSEADASALHVRLADEAYLLGPAPSSESYLRIDRVVEVARMCGAEAIHPGYGFLAENAAFARAVNDAGMVFIGPSPGAMELMGSKTSARRAAEAAGAPVVPGTTSALASLDEARATAERVGYPIMLKAAAGGGGKGMRLVAAEDELASAFETARSEAEAAFGDSSIYIEKAIERPRHIEIQVFADTHGACVHLGERECSIQRRHQKVIEECPSPIGDPYLREAMGAAAVEIARAASYVGAGTVEFLVSDVTRDFFFLEMNTRLQVEHPVTELVTGLDLVREQIRVAAGLPLSFTQSEVRLAGHAVECRVYAEDPEQNFMPSPGRINVLRVPSGPGVRDDGGVYEGAEVSIYYDPMISKLATWGRTRLEAIERMRRALSEYTVGGIKTTLPFFREVMRDEEFVAGRLDTSFISRFNERRAAAREASDAAVPSAEEIARRDVALVAAALAYTEPVQNNSQAQPAPSTPSRWKIAGRTSLHQSRL
ncbi:MAG: acetyl-CoA carboxylase, biotin carboxylase subunit [Acidobacteriota bacterium]|jgi:acetyl-CoA carboxylase biotin carboxylase subunit|nr:acetyl-CoA carboxylase, biotin carboxylase subunit [Acidobacteriota bacterium]MDT7806810.1 acetyl-CoA carboxylase, biotin carboxylase subunit [Acidobacteriota bacterium]